MNEKAGAQKNLLWFTAPIAILLAIAAGSGILIEGLYRDVPDMVAQAQGQDLVSLVILLPLLITTAILARRGSLQSGLLWMGGLVYLVYTYASFAFAIRYNPLFLVYIALLGTSLFALIAYLATLDMNCIKERFIEKTPVKAVSLFLAGLVLLFYCLWLSELIPALAAGTIPQSIHESGTPTNVIYVLDMAWILPSFGIAAASLWRKQPLGYTMAGILLSFFILLVLAILSMTLFQAQGGNLDAVPKTVIFGTLFALAAGMLAWYLTGLRIPPPMENKKAVQEAL